MRGQAEKIVLVADRLIHDRAGTERQLIRLGSALRDAGWDCRLVVLRTSTYAESGDCPIPVDCLHIRSMASPASWWRAASFALRLRRDGVRLVHLFFNDTSVLLPPFLKAAGIRVVISRRDMGFWYTPGLLRALRLNRHFVDAVAANSEAVAAQTASSEGYARSQIHVIHNALDPSFGAGIELSPQTNGPVLGIVANIRPVKRIEDAVEALARVGAEFSSARLRIVGGGDRGPIRQAAAAFDVEDRVEFAGPSEEPAAEMRGFTIGLLTSETEGFSNTLMEYQQLGVPVISSDGGGNPELVRDAVTGLVYPVGDVQALAAGIRRLLSDAELRDRLGRAGKAAVRELCDPERTLREYQGLYHGLMRGLDDSVTADMRQL